MIMKCTFFKDKKGEWRWNLRARNNRIIADSGQGYKNLSDCKHGFRLVKFSFLARSTVEESK